MEWNGRGVEKIWNIGIEDCTVATDLNGMEWRKMEWNERKMEWNEEKWNGEKWNGMEKNGTE